MFLRSRSVSAAVLILGVLFVFVVPARAAAPASVTSVVPVAADGEVALSWDNPSSASFTGTMVRYSTTAFPASSTDGTLADDVAGTPSGTSALVVNALTNGTTYYFSLFSHDATPTYGTEAKATQQVMAARFTEDFESDSLAAVDGQNGWNTVGGTWNVIDTSGEQTLQSGSDNLGFHLYRVLNDAGAVDATDQMIRLDWKGSTTSLPGQVFLRAQSDSVDAGGYFLWQTGTQLRIAYKAGAGSAQSTLARGSFTPAVNTWYTYEFSVVDNTSGQPVLTAYVWPRGSAKPSTPTVTYTDTAASFSQGTFSVGKTNTTVAEYDNILYYTTVPTVTVTSPSASVAAAPNVATRAITDEGGTFYIPYIQTTTTLDVSASATDATAGGVEFVLNEGLSSEQTFTDSTAPFVASFSALSKGEYTLDVYALQTDGTTRFSGSDAHDSRSNIGIGDIIAVIGDSVTEGIFGTINSTSVTSWLDADVGTVSADLRQFPQHGHWNDLYKESFFTDLQDQLEDYTGYPVFLMNEGWGGISAWTYGMNAAWRRREVALAPTAWMITLGVNDAYSGRTAAQYEAAVTTIISTLTTRCGATADQIYLNYPNRDWRKGKAGMDDVFVLEYIGVIDSLRASLGLAGGVDLYHPTAAHYTGEYIDKVHPNATGYERVARVIALGMMSPTLNTVTSSAADSVTIDWTSISSYEPTIAGYYVKYGTASDALTSTATFGDVATGTITGLTPSTTYYFAVQAYDNDTAAISTSALSATESFAL